MTDLTSEIKSLAMEMEKRGKMFFLANATKEQISSFENKNKFKLPSQYVAWLLFSDGGELFLPAGAQLYGVAHQPAIDPNDTDKYSDDYIIIGRLASGDPILCEKESERISIYNHDAGTIECDEVYPDFLSFLNELPELLGVEG